MILAVDIDYREQQALAAGVLFNHWVDSEPSNIFHSIINDVKAYESGAFYKRELPCILQLLSDYNLKPECIVIDGYVELGDDQRAGLGIYLHNALKQACSVIGVAKKSFQGTPTNTEILRGKSLKPLYVTSIGVSHDIAKQNILSMHGNYRIPTLLKLADSECRKATKA